MSEHFDPEAKDMLMQLLGQTYGELHKLDQFIVGPSQQLQPKSESFKQTVANVTRAINSNVPPSTPTVRIERPVHVSAAPSVGAAAVATTSTPVDVNQLEFGFDDSVTAKTIDKALARIEDKLDRLTRAVSSLIDSKRK